MRDLLVLLGSVVVAMGWLPIMLKFFRAWRGRKNPVSLAICALIVFALYVNVVVTSSYDSADTASKVVVIVIWAFNALICANFYFAFRLADKRFNNDRK